MRRDVRWLVLLAVIQVGVWPSGAQAQVAPAIAVQPEVAQPGDAVEVGGRGWDNDCEVVLTLDSDEGPRLGSAVPDQGVFTEEVTVPADAAPGDHQVVATGRLFGDVDTQPGTCGGPSGTRATAPLLVRAPDTAELVLSRDDVDFGAVEVGDASEESLVATNVGTITLEGVDVDLVPAGEAFAVTDDACTGRTLRPQESCALTVAFRPDATEDASARLLVTSVDVDAPATAVLTGTGVPDTGGGPDTAELVLSRDDVDFGAVEVGDVVEERLVATNVGTPALEGVDVDVEPAQGAFAVTDDACTGRTLLPEESCALTVAFQPDATQDARATLVLTSDDLEDFPTTTLTGTGVPVGEDVAVRDLGEWLWALVLLLGVAALGVTTVARGRSRRWLRAHVRVDPRGAALIEATVDQPDGERSAAVRLEPHADAGTQSLEEV